MRNTAKSIGLLLGLLAAATTASAQQPSFRTNIGDVIFDGGESMVVDDIDGDGIVDLIFPGGQGGNVAIFYGLGDGFFEPQFDVFVGNVPVIVAIGDYNGDLMKDIATADSTSSDISVVLATGTREFSPDAIVTNPKTCSADGTPCTTAGDCPEGQTCEDHGVPSPNGMATADLNADQKLDLAVVSGEAQGGVAVLFGNGEGGFDASGFSPYATGLTSLAVRIADLTRDAKPDLVTANRDSSTVSVLVNAGGGVFMAAIGYPAGEAPVDLTVGDFNRDNRLDVAVANRNSNSFSLLLGNGMGALGSPKSFPAGTFPSTIASGDFDGDNRLDVVVGNSLSYDVTVAFGDGSAGFPEERSFLGGTGPAGVAAALIDGDTRPDIVVLGKSGESDGYKVLLGQAPRTFVSMETVRTGDTPTMLAIGDVNGDGLPDAIINGAANELTVIRPQPDNSYHSSELNPGGEVSAAVLADLDRDGFAELVMAMRGNENDFIGVSRSDAHGGFAVPALSAVGREPSAVEAADFNEDGLLDIAVTEAADDTVAIFLTQPDGSLGAPNRIQLRPLGEQDAFLPQAVGAADLDGDGNIDLAIAIFRDDGRVSILYGRGDGTFENQVNMPSGRRPLGVALSDVDNDGRIDIVTVNQDTSGMIVHHASGPRTYDAPRTLGVGKVPASLALRDVNGDGIRDALVADRSTDDRIVIRPGGSTTAPFFKSVIQGCPEPNCAETGRTPVSIAGADFNGDGSYDVMTVNNGGSNVAVALSTLSSSLLRGDVNGDARISAADLPGLMAQVPRYNRQAVEDLVRADKLPTQAYDADGDGLLSSVDSIGIAGLIFR